MDRRRSAHRGRTLPGQVPGLHAAGLRRSAHQVDAHDAGRGSRLQDQGKVLQARDSSILKFFEYPYNRNASPTRSIASISLSCDLCIFVVTEGPSSKSCQKGAKHKQIVTEVALVFSLFCLYFKLNIS